MKEKQLSNLTVYLVHTNKITLIMYYTVFYISIIIISCLK